MNEYQELEEAMEGHEHALLIDDIHETYPPKKHIWVREGNKFVCKLHKGEAAFIRL